MPAELRFGFGKIRRLRRRSRAGRSTATSTPGRSQAPQLASDSFVAFVLFVSRALPLYTTTQRTLAFGVFALGTAPAAVAFVKRTRFPIMEIVALQYAVYFALPVFFEERMMLVGQSPIVPTAASI